ncbi:MAG: Na+/H+ antiporter subunit E [Pseudomonadota bacterium]
MSKFAANLILAVLWASLMGTVTVTALAVGFVIGFAVLWIVQPLFGEKSTYFSRVISWIRLFFRFHYELLVSSLSVAWDVITPGQSARPAIVEMPLSVKTDQGILMITNLISLTPGTLSLNVSDDRKTLLIHAMFADDPEAICRDIKGGLERLVIKAVEGA